MWQNGTENQVIAPILPKYDGQIIEIEEDENRNMCMCNSKYPIQAIFFGLWLLCSSVAFQNRDILGPDWGRVGIQDSQSKSGLSRLNRDGWTLCNQ